MTLYYSPVPKIKTKPRCRNRNEEILLVLNQLEQINLHETKLDFPDCVVAVCFVVWIGSVISQSDVSNQIAEIG